MYGGARPCRDLKTMILNSLLISSSMVFWTCYKSLSRKKQEKEKSEGDL